MRKTCLRLVAAEHAGNLGSANIPSHLIQMRLGNVAGLFTDHVVLVGHNRNLRQVCYDDDLMRGGKIGQHTSKSAGRGAADTSIDLVKHQRIDTVSVTEDNLTCQHDAAELAARRNAAQGTWRQAGTAAV